MKHYELMMVMQQIDDGVFEVGKWGSIAIPKCQQEPEKKLSGFKAILDSEFARGFISLIKKKQTDKVRGVEDEQKL